MKHSLLPFALLSALACSTPDSSDDAAPAHADAVAEARLPLVRYYVIGDT
jgi:hypothetical protein